jgi:hypothetical protein
LSAKRGKEHVFLERDVFGLRNMSHLFNFLGQNERHQKRLLLESLAICSAKLSRQIKFFQLNEFFDIEYSHSK